MTQYYIEMLTVYDTGNLRIKEEYYRQRRNPGEEEVVDESQLPVFSVSELVGEAGAQYI
jgi:hypothetical protein